MLGEWQSLRNCIAASTAFPNGMSVALNWTEPWEIGSGEFLGYLVYRAVVSAGVTAEPVLLGQTGNTTYLDTSNARSTTYVYSVRAVCSCGEGPARIGDPVTVVPEEAPWVPEISDGHRIAGPPMLWAAVAVAVIVANALAAVLLSRRRR